MSFSGFCPDDLPATLQLTGDFYREPDNAVRGISFPCSAFDFNSLDDAQGLQFSGHWQPMKEATTNRNFVNYARRFRESEHARSVPDDPFFRLEHTTKHLLGISPARAGNLVLDFLERDIASTVTKVSDKSFSIKADVYHDGLGCQIKIYIYQQGSDCAIEFQRRGGAAIAFVSIYDQAAAYLGEQTATPDLDLSSTCSRVTASNVYEDSHSKGMHDHGKLGEAPDCLNALLEIPWRSPLLQEEVASSLLGIVENSKVVATFCKPEVFDVLAAMVTSNRFATAYPASRVLALLADLPEAQSCFLTSSLFNSVLSTVWVEETGPAVWLQLAGMMYSIVSTCAPRMTTKERQDTSAVITAVLEKKEFASNPEQTPNERIACVGQRLRDGLCILGAKSF